MNKMRKASLRVFSMILVVVMFVGLVPTNVTAYGSYIDDPLTGITGTDWNDINNQTSSDNAFNADDPDSDDGGLNNPNNSVNPDEDDISNESPLGLSGTENENNALPQQHWIQQYQEWVQGQLDNPNKGRASTPEFSMITWGSGADSDAVRFANGAYVNSPLPKIYLNGDVAFCGQFNGLTPGGSYEQIGSGNDTRIKQILANYDNSNKSSGAYAATQIAIWARIMNTSVTSWGTCPGASYASAILNGTNDYSDLKYDYLQWSGGTQDLITYNTEEDTKPVEPPDYPEDKYRIEVKTDVVTETEVRQQTTYEYSDAIGQITIRKHDQDGKSLDGALFNIDVAFTDGSHVRVNNWEVDNGARLFTWNHPKDNHDPATVTITEVVPPRYYEGDPTPKTAVVHPTYTRVTHVTTWTITITTENTVTTVIEIDSGEVVAETTSSSSAETRSNPQVQEYADFIEGDRETTVTFVNRRITGDIEVIKKDANTGQPLAGASIHLWGDDLGEAGLIDLTEVTGTDGIAYFRNLPPGTYVIQETGAPMVITLITKSRR